LAGLMAAQGAFGTDFYDRSILRLKHRAYYRSGRPVIKIGPKGALGIHDSPDSLRSKPRTEYIQYPLTKCSVYKFTGSHRLDLLVASIRTAGF